MLKSCSPKVLGQLLHAKASSTAAHARGRAKAGYTAGELLT
jgi:hypothetical protein